MIIELGLIIYIILFIIIGVSVRRYAKELEDYWVMHRNANYFLFAGTLSATYVSMWTFGAGIGLTWAWGFDPVMLFYTSSITFGWIIACILIGMRLRKMNLLSIDEFFIKRFGHSVLLAAMSSLVIIASMYFYLLIQFQGMGIFFSITYNIPYEVTLWLSILLVFLAVYFAGMWSVVVTDTFTFVIFWVVLLTFLPTVMSIAGHAGIEAANTAGLWSAVGASKKDMLYFTSLALAWLAIIGGAPHIINRTLIVKSTKELLKGLTLAYILTITLTLSLFLGSAMLRVFIPSLKAVGLRSLDDIAPFLYKNVFPEWLGAIMMIGAIGAALTTADTMGITAAQGVVNIIKTRFKLEEKMIIRLTYITCLIVFLLTGVVAYQRPWILAIASSLAGMYSGMGLLPVFLLSLYWRRVTKKAVILTFIISLILSSFMIVTNYFFGWFAPFPTLYALPLGFIMLIAFTFLTKQTPEEKESVDEMFKSISRMEKFSLEKSDITLIAIVAIIAIIVFITFVWILFGKW
jgi:Na+/proline symporter